MPKKSTRRRNVSGKTPAAPPTTQVDTTVIAVDSVCDLLDGEVEDDMDEVYWPDEDKNKPEGGWPPGVVPIRVVNSFAFLDMQDRMCTANDLRAKNAVKLIGWVSSASGGVRRVHRLLCGYSPTKESEIGDEDAGHVWRLRSTVCKFRVNQLYVDDVDILGFKRQAAMAAAADGSAEYILQWPHPNYSKLWDQTIQIYARARVYLPIWEDVDPTQPRPRWCHPWTMEMLRMELGLSAKHPQDPQDRPNFAPPGASDDEYELGESDAESIELNHDSMLPTGTKWRGGVPRPWPRQIMTPPAPADQGAARLSATPPRNTRRRN